MPYDEHWLREFLWEWGDAQAHGPWRGHAPADPQTPRLAVFFGPRLPCDAALIDVSRAFAALNPRLPRRLDDLGSYYASRQFTRPQVVLWLYYVRVWGTVRFRQDWATLSREARTLLLELDERRPGRHVVPEDGRGDALIAAHLGVSRRTVYYDRNRAIDAMLAFLNPPHPPDA